MKKNYSRFIVTIAFIFAAPLFSAAQTAVFTGDSLAVRKNLVDSLLLGKNIFDILSEKSTGKGNVVIVQSSRLRSTVDRYISKAAERKLMGFRVRIFLDNAQNARAKSEEVATLFSEKYPEISSYRTYREPYFRVSVGDFRTKSEAEKFRRQIEKDYPSSFIVNEDINYPSL